MQAQLKIDFEGKPNKAVDVVVYAFDQRGTLIASAPLKDGAAQLTFKDDAQRQVRLFFAPPPKPHLTRDKTLSIEDMERLRAYEPVWEFDAKRNHYELAPIPEFHWKWWWWCVCRVRGRVVKPVTISDVHYDMPVCHARVHVCEVDPILWLIPRLPDSILDKIRRELLVLIEQPLPHPIPDPDPGPLFEFDTAVRDVSPRAMARMQSAGLSSDAQMLNPQPLPPKAQMITAGGALGFSLKAALASPAMNIVRQALLEHVAVIRPFLCAWPWLWPYLHRCDEVAMLHTDAQGRFDATLWYLCFGDHPDLYFWVEYCIGGVWTTVYRPPVRCNTYWDYACGSEVILRVTDPRVPWCGDPNPLPGKQLAVLLVGNNLSMTQIQRSAAGANEGLTTAGQPLGGSLEPHVWFGDALIASGITHYRWSYQRLTRADGTAVVDGWHALDRQVVRHYAEIQADSTLLFKPYTLGPDPAFGAQTLFQIRPVNPPLNPGATSSSWAPEIDARENTASGFFQSHLLGDPALAAGKYALLLELFHSDGTPVNLSDEGVALKVPTIDGPFGVGTVPTQAVAHHPAQIGDMEDRVVRGAGGKIVGFRLVVHVDNNVCEALIAPVVVDGHTANPCGFVDYNDKATSQAHIQFTALHPNNFASFSFSIARGSSGVVEQASGPVGSNPSPVGGYARSAGSVFSKNLPVATLLGGCDKAAFAENLHVDAWATDGWSTLDYLDADAIPVAFALEPVPPV